MRSEVYSWRLTKELKSDLEREARRRGVAVSKVLEMAVRGWLKGGAAEDEEARQRRLHAEAGKYIGAFSSRELPPSTQVREVVRDRLGRKYGR